MKIQNIPVAMFGHPADKLIGQPISILMLQRFREAHRHGMAKVVASGDSHMIDQTGTIPKPSSAMASALIVPKNCIRSITAENK